MGKRLHSIFHVDVRICSYHKISANLGRTIKPPYIVVEYNTIVNTIRNKKSKTLFRLWTHKRHPIPRPCSMPHEIYTNEVWSTLIARFMGPTWGPSGADRAQMGLMLAPWTLLSGMLWVVNTVKLIVLSHNDFSSSGEQPELRPYVITTNDWFYSNISQIMMLHETCGNYNKFDSAKLKIYYGYVKIPNSGWMQHGLNDIKFYVQHT